MTFKILNEADSIEDPTDKFPQAEPDSVDFDILAAALESTAVLSGCDVTPQGTPDTTIAVAAGAIAVLGVDQAVTGGNVDCLAADGTNPRFDLVVVDNAGVKSAVNGTASATPVFPAIPASSVVLAAVYRAAGDDAIAAGEIVDKRILLPLRIHLQKIVVEDTDGTPVGDVLLRTINEILEVRNKADSAYKQMAVDQVSLLSAASTAFHAIRLNDFVHDHNTGGASGGAIVNPATLRLQKSTKIIDANGEISLPTAGGFAFLSKAGGGPHDLNGIGAGGEGQVLILTPTAGKDITLKHDGTTTARKKLMLNGEADFTLDEDHDIAFAVWDVTADYWKVLVPTGKIRSAISIPVKKPLPGIANDAAAQPLSAPFALANCTKLKARARSNLGTTATFRVTIAGTDRGSVTITSGNSVGTATVTAFSIAEDDEVDVDLTAGGTDDIAVAVTVVGEQAVF